jgi:hypothetical protein
MALPTYGMLDFGESQTCFCSGHRSVQTEPEAAGRTLPLKELGVSLVAICYVRIDDDSIDFLR